MVMDAASGGGVAPPLLLNGVSHSQQDPELLARVARCWVLWEDRRIDFLSGNGNNTD